MYENIFHLKGLPDVLRQAATEKAVLTTCCAPGLSLALGSAEEPCPWGLLFRREHLEGRADMITVSFSFSGFLAPLSCVP